jgi:hypothetical protein
MLSALLAACWRWLAHCTAGRHWRAWLVGLSVALAVLNQLPPYRHTYRGLAHGTELEANFQVFQRQVANPWQTYSTIDNSHPAKMVFRLTLPLLARRLHLSILHILLLQLALGVLMYWQLATGLARLLADRVAASLFVLGTSGTYFGSAFAYDLFGYFDAFCYALLVLVFFARRGWVIFLLVLLGGFIDERLLLATPLAVAWFGVEAYGWHGAPAWRYLFTRRATAVYAAGLAYTLLRIGLAQRYQLVTYTGLVGLDALRDNLRHEWLSIGYLFGLKAYWLMVLVAIALLLYRRAYGLLAVLGLCAAPILLGSALVTDITRSLAYAGPIVILIASLLRTAATVSERRTLGLLVASLALLAPSYHVLGKIVYQPSLAQQALKALAGQLAN